MKERPILFSGEMVRAILDGRKTQTRRVVKPQPLYVGPGFTPYRSGEQHDVCVCPYGQPGDRLWVRETWQLCECGVLSYRATVNRPNNCAGCDVSLGKWRPAIHLFREYARIDLEIVAVRVERLKQISNEDCFAEGLPAETTKGNRTWYADLWESINGKGSWDLDPWVWVVEFKRVERVGS